MKLQKTRKGLKRTLSARSLVALGVGAIIGAGLFSLTGTAACWSGAPYHGDVAGLVMQNLLL
jgi:L-asparagine transporter-like permease